jgi:hypothetical protein
MGATPGSGATALSQAAWLPVDATTKARIRTFVEGFALFIEAQRCLD